MAKHGVHPMKPLSMYAELLFCDMPDSLVFSISHLFTAKLQNVKTQFYSEVMNGPHLDFFFLYCYDFVSLNINLF